MAAVTACFLFFAVPTIISVWHFSITYVNQASLRKCTFLNPVMGKCKAFDISGAEAPSAIFPPLFLVHQYFPQCLLPWLGMQRACKLV